MGWLRGLGWVVLSFAVLLGGTGCSQSHYDVGPFGSYVEAYKTQAVKYGKSADIPMLEMSFHTVSEDLQGYCTFVPFAEFDGLMKFDLVPTVYIDQNDWQTTDDESDREALIFHELGHCLLARVHDARMMPGDIETPISIMNPVKLPKGVYAAHHDYYVNELFNPAPAPTPNPVATETAAPTPSPTVTPTPTPTPTP